MSLVCPMSVTCIRSTEVPWYECVRDRSCVKRIGLGRWAHTEGQPIPNINEADDFNRVSLTSFEKFNHDNRHL